MDDPWRNGVMIEKAGDPIISRLEIPEDWMPPPLNIRETNFEDLENPDNWPRY